MDRRFPTFRTNYPSSLMSLGDYVNLRRHEMAMGSRPLSAKSAPGRRRRPASAASFRSARVGGTGGGHVTGTTPASHPSFRLTDVSSHQAHVKTEIARHTSTSAEADLSAVKELELTDEVEFDTREVADLLRKHLSLRCLSLARSYVTDEVMDIVAETCPLLDELNLTSTFPLTAAAVARAVAQCPRLRVVHLSKCDHMFSDDEAAATLLAAIAHPASLVQDLRLNRNPTLSDTALRGLHRAPPPDDPFIHRTAETSKTSDGGKGEEEASSGGHGDAQLDIDGHDAHAGMDDWFYSGAATDSKGDKSANLPLVCLDLSGCTGITDVGFRHLAQACSNLQQLRLQLCDQAGLTAAGIASIAECMPSLVSLDLSGCRQVTSDTIVAIATGCPHLRSILLSGCVQVGDAAVSAIAQHCTQLVHLDLTLCGTVTFNSVHQLTAACTSLGFINVTMCPKLTVEHVAFLEHSVSTLKVLCHASDYTHKDAPSLVPGFKPPPAKLQWKAVTNMSNFKKPKKGKGKGKGKKKKK